MREYGDKVSQKLPWLQENLQDFHSAMCMCILDSSLQVGGGHGEATTKVSTAASQP